MRKRKTEKIFGEIWPNVSNFDKTIYPYMQGAQRTQKKNEKNF